MGADPEELEPAAGERNAPRETWEQVPGISTAMQDTEMSRFYLYGRFDPQVMELELSRLTELLPVRCADA